MLQGILEIIGITVLLRTGNFLTYESTSVNRTQHVELT